MRFDTVSVNGSSVSNRCICLKKHYGSGMTALITSKEEMDDIIEIVKSRDECGLLIKKVCEKNVDFSK